MWKWVVGSHVGYAHTLDNLRCQDAAHFAMYGGKTVVGIVADGAGSAKYGGLGSRMAVRASARWIKKSLYSHHISPLETLHTAAYGARRALRNAAKRRGASLSEYATTLLMVVMSPEGGAVAQIGDGVVVFSEDNVNWNYEFWPQHGEYLNTTCFITDEQWEDEIQYSGIGANVISFAMSTDGLELLILNYAHRVPHQPFFREMFKPIVCSSITGYDKELSMQLIKYLGSDHIASRSTDDVTIILAVRSNAGYRL